MSQKKKIDPQEAYILVVEDDLQNTVLISRLLDFMKIRGYAWKASGWQILEATETLPRVDLVLLDIHLPRENGYEVIARLRRDPRFAATRVLAVTADAGPQMMEKARQAGFDGFLGKPIDPERFPTQIAAVLRGEEVWDLGAAWRGE